jgi:hypothetical protein
MPIEDHYDKNINTERLSEESGISEYDPNLTGVAAHIQPLDEAYSEDLDGSFGKDSMMFCAVVDILEGDRVIDGTDEYRVVGVKKYKFLGEDKHMEVRIRQFND